MSAGAFSGFSDRGYVNRFRCSGWRHRHAGHGVANLLIA